MSEVSMVEQKVSRAQPRVEQKTVAIGSELIKSADSTFLSHLKKSPEIARQVLRLSAQRLKSSRREMALTASAIPILAACNFGSAEKQNIPPPLEPTPAVSQIEKMPSETIEFTRTPPPTEAPATPSPTQETPSKSPQQKEQSEEYLLVGLNKVYFNKEGLPLKYIRGDGKVVFFNIEEMRNLRNKTLSSEEPEIAAMLVDDIKPEVYTPSRERPKTKRLPDDVLPEEELQKRGVEIMQADNTSLYIREGAFAEDGPFRDFESAKRKMTIVLVEGPVVSAYFLQDPKYAEVKKLLPEEAQETKGSVDSWRAKNIEHFDKAIDFYRQKKIEAKRQISGDSSYTMGVYNDLILKEKANLFYYEKVHEQDLLTDMPRGGLQGYYQLSKGYIIISSDPKESGRRGVGNTTIFLAVGRGKDDLRQQTNMLYFTPEGTVKSIEVRSPSSLSEDPRVRAQQTHPKPKDFLFRGVIPNDTDYYSYGAQGFPGHTLRHELGHDKLIAQKFIKEETFDRSETHADLEAMEGLRKAWEKWEKSGFTDNSGYYFVFSLPEGGYILTENKPSSSNPSSKL